VYTFEEVSFFIQHLEQLALEGAILIFLLLAIGQIIKEKLK
jgi:hypothetical protein